MKEIDWEQRRYEIARDFLTAIIVNEDLRFNVSLFAKKSVELADALIEELKKK